MYSFVILTKKFFFLLLFSFCLTEDQSEVSTKILTFKAERNNWIRTSHTNTLNFTHKSYDHAFYHQEYFVFIETIELMICFYLNESNHDPLNINTFLILFVYACFCSLKSFLNSFHLGVNFWINNQIILIIICLNIKSFQLLKTQPSNMISKHK